MMCIPRRSSVGVAGQVPPSAVGKRSKRSTADNITKWAKAFQRQREEEQQGLRQGQQRELEQGEHKEEGAKKESVLIMDTKEQKPLQIVFDATEVKEGEVKMIDSDTELKEVKQEYQEYGGSEDDEMDNEHFVSTSNYMRGQQLRKREHACANAHVDTFINTLLHALRCNRGCNSLSCRKMRLVLSHFLSCPKLSLSLPCPLCQQLNNLISIHAQTCAVDVNGCCPVPLCDTMRPNLKKNVRKEGKQNYI